MKDNNYQEAQDIHLQANAEQTGRTEFFVLGHVSAYDPATHTGKVVFTIFTDSDSNFVESGWIPFATGWSGLGFGDQVAPYGGASVTDITGEDTNKDASPEQCIVWIISRGDALHAMGAFMFNTVDLPPGSNQAFFAPDNSMQLLTISSGERVMRAAGGQYIYFQNDGSIRIISNNTIHKPFKEPDETKIVRGVYAQSVAIKPEDQEQSDMVTSYESNALLSSAANGTDTATNLCTTVVAALADKGTTVTSTMNLISAATDDTTAIEVTSNNTLTANSTGNETATNTSTTTIAAIAETGATVTSVMNLNAEATDNGTATFVSATNGLTATSTSSTGGTLAAAANVAQATGITGSSAVAGLAAIANDPTTAISTLEVFSEAAGGAGVSTVSVSSTGDVSSGIALTSTSALASIDLTATGGASVITMTTDGIIIITAPLVQINSAAIQLGVGSINPVLTTAGPSVNVFAS